MKGLARFRYLSFIACLFSIAVLAATLPSVYGRFRPVKKVAAREFVRHVPEGVVSIRGRFEYLAFAEETWKKNDVEKVVPVRYYMVFVPAGTSRTVYTKTALPPEHLLLSYGTGEVEITALVKHVPSHDYNIITGFVPPMTCSDPALYRFQKKKRGTILEGKDIFRANEFLASLEGAPRVSTDPIPDIVLDMAYDAGSFTDNLLAASFGVIGAISAALFIAGFRRITP